MPEPTQIEDFDPQKYWRVLKRRWPVVLTTFLGCSILATIAATLNKPTYEAQGQLLVQSNRTQSLTGVGEKIGNLESLKREGNPMDTQAVVVQSSPLVQQVITNLQLKGKNGQSLDPTDLKLKVEPIAGTDVLKVNFAADRPQIAADVVNQLMQAYIQSNVQNNRSEAIAAGSFVDQQLPRAKQEMEMAAAALRQFRERFQIVELEKESAALIDSLKVLSDQSSQTKAQLADIAAQQLEINRQAGIDLSNAVEAASVSQLPGIQASLADLQKQENQLQLARARYTEVHPEVLVLQDEVNQLRSLLNQRVSEVTDQVFDQGDIQVSPLRQTLVANYIQLQAQRLGLENKINALSQQQASFADRSQLMPSLNQQHTELMQRFALAKKTYESLVAKIEDIRIAERQTVGNARIIQPALVPTQPSTRQRNLLMLGGSGLGLMLGIAAAFWVDLIDRRLKSVKEVQSLLDYTLLGVIPFHRSPAPNQSSNFSNDVSGGDGSSNDISDRIAVLTTPRSVVHDAFRMLQANLKFMNFDRKVKTIVITSALSGEGKSEVSANLAATLANSGKRVLLIDADLRSPSQHHLWGLINRSGLSNVIVEEDTLNHVLQPIMPNLTVLTAGSIPPDPVTLLESESMAQMLQKLAKDYEYILFDAPPLAGIVDAAVLGKLANGVLWVARPNFVTYDAAVAAQDLLRRSGAQVLGLVTNAVNLKREPNNFFYYTGSSSESMVSVRT